VPIRGTNNAKVSPGNSLINENVTNILICLHFKIKIARLSRRTAF
jgi:small subunit ribosomal protein S13